MKVATSLTILSSMSDKSYRTRQTLLEKIKDKHDEDSWQDFVFYYDRFIYTICRKMNLNHHDAEEVVQKVLLISWNKMPKFKYDSSKQFRGWICNLTGLCVKDFYRSVKRYNDRVENLSEHYEPDSFIGDISDVNSIIEDEWKTYIVSMAMLNIKDKFSENVINVFEELSQGKSPKEISRTMNIPYNTVIVYRKRFAEKLSEEVKRLKHELG